MGSESKMVPSAEVGEIQINEDGVWNTYYLPGATTLDGGKTVKYTPPYRFYLMKYPTTDYSNADNFYMPPFAGKTFSVDIDFKKNGPSCGCNLNFYLVDKPFTFSQRFDVSGDDFTFTTTMTQETRQVVQRMGPGSAQLNAMLEEIQKGMV